MGTHIRFNDDNYEPSDSEEDMSENDLELLKKVRNKGKSYSDSEEEVFGVNSEDEESDIALSDVEGQGENDDGIPDAKAWGKNKRHYYSTDYIDPDYDGFQGKDATMAEIEEEEARTLQNALAKSMDDDDFSLGFITETKDDRKEEQEEIIKSDISKLSKRQKLQLLQKESPEFFGLVEDYEQKIALVCEMLDPIIQLHKNNKIKKCSALDFVRTYYELILNYCTNIYMYLLLKAERSNVKNHPVIKRLYQYRQLLSQMDPVFGEIIKPQLEIIISQNDGNLEETDEKMHKKKKTLKLLSNLITKSAELENKKQDIEESLHPKKKKKLEEPKSILKTEESKESKNVTFGNNCGLAENAETDSEEDKPQIEEEEGEVNESGKRGITYQIAKNKGLMPRRKKELRNPRVKHRNKFRKAIIRRKGAVREVRHEMSRYGGEMSGIKASVTKSIKLKS